MITLDLKEAAHFLRIHPKTLEAKARNKEIPAAKPGKHWVFIDIDLANWMRSQYQPANDGGKECHSSKEAISIGASGLSAARKLEKLLAQPTKKRPKNTMTADVLKFGAPQN